MNERVHVFSVGPKWSLDRVTNRTPVGQAICEQKWELVFLKEPQNSCMAIDNIPFNVTTAIVFLYVVDSSFRTQETIDAITRASSNQKLTFGSRRHAKMIVSLGPHLFSEEILRKLC